MPNEQLLHERFRVLSWNCQGVPQEAVENFVGDLSESTDWDVLSLYEFSFAKTVGELRYTTRDGLIVFLQPSCKVRSSCAIVLHNHMSSAVGEGQKALA